MNPASPRLRRAGLLALFFLLPITLFAYVSPGKPVGYVNDFAHMLSPATAQNLEAELTSFTNSTGHEIAVVTVPTIGTDETIETYATKLFEEWKIGDKKFDTGLLLLIARDDRQMRIEVGYGLEPAVTDIESGRIISDVLAPAFRQGDYDGGVTAAVTRLENDAKTGVPDVARNPSPSVDWGGLLSRFFYLIVFAFMFLGSILSRTKSWWLGGVLGGIAAVIIGFAVSLSAGLLSAVVLIPLGLLFDYIVSKRGPGPGGRPPFIFLGGGGGFGRGGGGFGGFSGGSSGGGGASGRW